ncbi:MAG: hypothetical protein MIO92_16640, partial [Methanosarcinaceae archaeon]|nr:hypothetical protein [Methanosarcinaceae archaeon]
MRKIHLIVIFSFGIFLGLCELAYSWGNKKTHPALTDKAISASVINDYLKTQLDLRDGVTAELKWDFPSHIKERLDKGTAEPDKTTRTILAWVKAGS